MNIGFEFFSFHTSTQYSLQMFIYSYMDMCLLDGFKFNRFIENNLSEIYKLSWTRKKKKIHTLLEFNTFYEHKCIIEHDKIHPHNTFTRTIL